jgi:hypothetical protein
MTSTSTLRRWSGPLVVAILLATASLAIALVEAPAPPRDPPAPAEFSAERAWAHIEEIARSPRPVGTPAHDRARSYVLAELEALGLEVDTLTVLSSGRWGPTVMEALTRNVMARLRGTASTGAVLVMSHYDTAPLAPGAGDAGIGVATVLESARALAAGEVPRNDIVFVLTDAEELGLLGALAFAETHPWADDVAFVLNFEARGTSGPAVLFETGPGSGWAVQQLGRVGRRAVTSSIIPEAYARMPNDTDFTVFRGRGMPGLNFAIGASAEWYHTPGDNPENLSRASVHHMGHNGLRMARLLAATDLEAVPRTERVYFHVPGFGLVNYPPSWTVPLGVLLVAAYLATGAWVARRGRLTWWGIPLGLVAAVAGLLAAILAAHWLWGAVQFRHDEWGSLFGRAIYREWPYTLAVTALTIALVTGIFGLLRRWLSAETLALGALLLPVAGGVATAFILPSASYLLLWPTLLALATTALLATGEDPGTGPRPNRWRTGAAVGGAVLIVLLLAPTVYLVHALLSIAVAPLIAAVVGVLVLLLIPAIDLMGPPNRAWLPTAGMLLGAGLAALGASDTSPAAHRPAPSNLTHVQDGDAGTAFWAAPATHDDAFTRRFLPPTADTTTLERYSDFLRGIRFRVAPAPMWPAPATTATIVETTPGNTLRTARVRLQWDEPPMLVEVRPIDNTSRLLEPTGDSIPGTPPTGAGTWRLGRAGLERPLELLLEAPTDEAIELAVTAHYQGLPPLQGNLASRPAGLMAVPIHYWRPTVSDVRVVRETLVF